ncbi:MAG TPA: DUF3224 domain-containing protein [Terriglobales bacterium]|nr:DUF3224 domain-containing protein [Terriglobales bacterium]
MMKPWIEIPVTLAIWLSVALLAFAQPQTAPAGSAANQEQHVAHATGTLEVKLTPQPSDPPLGRMTLDKQFHGGLEGSSKGEMLTAGSGAKGSSGGYVALESFTGTLDGRKGSFVLQHSGTMTAGSPQLTITVVPGSGTGELEGLTGKMDITMAGGKHSYDLTYTLPGSK